MNDQIRLQMVSKKINRKNINHEGLEDLKIKFYSYMIYYHNHENNYHDVSKCYRVIYDTYTQNEEIQDKMQKVIDFGFSLEKTNLLENLVLYLIISPHSLERE